MDEKRENLRSLLWRFVDSLGEERSEGEPEVEAFAQSFREYLRNTPEGQELAQRARTLIERQDDGAETQPADQPVL